MCVFGKKKKKKQSGDVQSKACAAASCATPHEECNDGTEKYSPEKTSLPNIAVDSFDGKNGLKKQGFSL